MTNTWFNNFLQSLFDKIGTDTKGLWLTQKQTDAFILNAERSQCITKAGCHDDFGIMWNNRKVILFYSKKSQTGNLVFGMTKEETEQHQLRVAETKDLKEIESLKRSKERNLERFNAKIENLKEQIEDLKEEIDFLTTEKENTNNLEILLDELNAKLNLMESL